MALPSIYAHRNFQHFILTSGETTWTTTVCFGEIIEVKSANSTKIYTYDKIHFVDEDEEGFYLWSGTYLIACIYKKSFTAGNVDNFYAFIKEKCSENKSLLTNREFSKCILKKHLPHFIPLIIFVVYFLFWSGVLSNAISYVINKYERIEMQIITNDDEFPDVAHMQLIRNLRMFWSSVESGSPWIDPDEPLGEGDTKALAAEITGLPPKKAQAKLIETARNIHNFVKRAELEPGIYKLPEHISKLYHERHGVAADGSFTFTEAHLTLLRHMRWRQAAPEGFYAILTDAMYPFPLTASKRPYGDLSWYRGDMARILGEPFAIGSDGFPVHDPEKEQRLEILHYETLPAMQALFLYGVIPKQ